MLRYLLLSLVLLGLRPCQAQQSLVFGYDEAGNQIKRYWEAPTQGAEQDSTQDQQAFLAYPNPSEGRFYIRIDPQRAAQLSRIRILTYGGQSLYDQAAASLPHARGANGFIEIPIDLSRNPLLRTTFQGVVTLSLRNGKMLTQKIEFHQP